MTQIERKTSNWDVLSTSNFSSCLRVLSVDHSKNNQLLFYHLAKLNIWYKLKSQKKIIWIKRLIKKLNLNEQLIDIHVNSVLINVDNQKITTFSKNPKYHFKTKHIDVQWHFVKKQVESKIVVFVYCPIDEMAVDKLIKSFDRFKFFRFFKFIEMTTTKMN